MEVLFDSDSFFSFATWGDFLVFFSGIWCGLGGDSAFLVDDFFLVGLNLKLV